VKSRSLYLIAVEGILLAMCLLLFCSCISFDIGDSPSVYVWPHNSPSANYCGAIGAFFAYYLLYYLGVGVFLLLTVVAWGVVVRLFGVHINQLLLRLIGLSLLVIALSSSDYLLEPYRAEGFAIGNGGILGIAVGSFLKSRFAVLGTGIIIICTWLVGGFLLADRLVLVMVKWFGMGVVKLASLVVPAFSAARKHSRAMSEIWRKLSEKQKQRHSAAAEASDQKFTKSFTRAKTKPRGKHKVAAEDNHIENTFNRRPAEPAAHTTSTSTSMSAREAFVPRSYEDYELPSLELLEQPEYGFAAIQEKMVDSKARSLENLLAEFNVQANVVNAEPGPAITMYELELSPGVKVSQISTLSNDMARALSAGSVRVVAPLAGRHTIGIEVPNSQREIVRIKDLIDRAGKAHHRMHVPLFLGKSSSGEVLVSDLAAMPHLLIAGTTGSGKSVCINSIITSIMLMRRPDEVKLILVDPKMVEMTMFDSIPHLMCPIVTDIKRAEQILEWAMTKMDERYELLAEAKVKNINSYNKLGPEEIIKRFNPSTPEEEAQIPKRLPYIIIIIDELADLMMTAAKEIEAYIVRIAQKSRAVGIHLVVATQRPQATVVTGLIKSNMPARIGFRVASRMDSRIILDQNGAETLLGEGDMLFLKPGTSDLVRSQGAFVDDKEIRKVVKHLKEVAEPQFHAELMQLSRVDVTTMAKDDLFDEAIRIVLESGRGSVSLLQRRLGIGYARASRIIELMGASGILGEYKGSQAREVLMTLKEYDQAQKQIAIDTTAGYADLNETEAQDDEYEQEEECEDAIEVQDESEIQDEAFEED